MQNAFDFEQGDDIAFIRSQLKTANAENNRGQRPDVMDQLIGSLISSLTHDDISLAVFRKLKRLYPHWHLVAKADEATIYHAISEVRHPEPKATHLLATVKSIGINHPDYDLRFLKDWSVGQAHAYLEAFDGVGPKVAASALNCALDMKTFVADTHGLRVLSRYGFIGKQDAWHACERVVSSVPHWSGADFWDFMIALKTLGREICRPKDWHCGACPLSSRCWMRARLS